MNVRTLLPAHLCVVALIALGCSGDHEGDATVTAAPGLTFSEAELSEALLALDDMPEGWRGGPTEKPKESDNTICGQEWESSAGAGVGAVFRAPEGDRIVEQSVRGFPPGEAEKELAGIVELAGSCEQWTAHKDEPREATWSISSLPFPRLGDDTAAFRLLVEEGDLGFGTIDLVYVRRGDLVTAVVHYEVGFQAVDSEETEAFVRRADEKLAALE